MKRILIVLFVFSVFIGNAQLETIRNDKSSDESDLFKKLESIPNIDSIITLSVRNHYSERYEIYYTQLLDPNDSSAGFFQQRIFLAHADYTKPVVFVTEGYGANYAQPAYYSNELSSVLNSNQIVSEHRYFGKSWPDSIDWQYLTVENAAHDHHELITAFKEIYAGKWLSTGISKGGQTSLIHMSLYPKDVDFSVPYVAPLNFGLEDGRHEPYIETISTKEDRKKIRDFQMHILENREILFPKFKEFVQKRNFTFRLPLEEIYDYCVLEYSFAFWQWGYPISKIPSNDDSPDKIFKHFMLVSSPSYFALEEIEATRSFFIQAYRQMGYYGYDTKPFKGLLKIKNADGYLKKVFIPEDVKFDFDSASMKKVQKFLDENDPKMIFIYGEFDPWSSTGVEFKKKQNMFKIVRESGSHATRIKSLPEKQRSFVIDKINEWLSEK